MKKIEIKGKLSLNKSTIANLNNEQMNVVKGGANVALNGNGDDAILWSLVWCKSHKTCGTVSGCCNY